MHFILDVLIITAIAGALGLLYEEIKKKREKK